MEIQFSGIRGTGLVSFTIDSPITLIVGPNGAGKSTVLNQIRQQSFGRHIYMGPHRAIRKQITRQRYLNDSLPSMTDVMSSQSLGGYEGITVSSHNRDAWELDEASNMFKYSLSKLEFQRTSALIRKFDKEGTILKSEDSDIWQPLRELTNTLLPTLSFQRIETENSENMRCLFLTSTDNIEIDFDDLSSGEKSIIQMLYPIIEDEIRARLNRIKETHETIVRKDYVIIDEPELHLHPALQKNLLSYLRIASEKYNYKFILATHSPQLIDAADEADIWLLRHRSKLTSSDDNQIVRIGSDPESAEALQQAIGSFYPAMASKPIVFIEGSPTVTVRNYSDRQILEFVDERFLGVTVVPRGGKRECISALTESRHILRNRPFQIKSAALVDRDQEIGTVFEDGAWRLPVAMIENLLLDPEYLRAGFNVVADRVSIQSDVDYQSALTEISLEVRDDEILRRFRALLLQGVVISPFNNVLNIDDANIAMQALDLQTKRICPETCWQNAQSAVDDIISGGRAMKLFSGKLILKRFMAKYAAPLGLTKSIFVYHAAKQVGQSGRYRDFFDKIFADLT